jgi:hypothetical protein
MPVINPRQIVLTALQPQNANANFSGRNASSYTGGPVTSVSNIRMQVHPTVAFGGVSAAIPLFSHSVTANSGPGAHYVLNESSVNWFNSTTGAFIANSAFASNYATTIAGTEVTTFDWLKAINPAVFDIPQSLNVDYLATRTSYTSQLGAMEFRNDIKTADPLVAGTYSNPYVMGNAYSINGLTVTGQLVIRTIGINNIFVLEIILNGNNSRIASNEIRIDVSRNRISNLLTTKSVYVKTGTLRSDFCNFVRTS